MRVAVITPYHAETIETLVRCISSVEDQTCEVTHLLVADGVEKALSGLVDEELAQTKNPTQHLRLPVAHSDYGDTPRLIGTISAYAQGFDAVCWLDADCWLNARHIEWLTQIANREVVGIVTASRALHRPDGSVLAECCKESDGETFCDTNCYLVMREAMPALASAWGFKPKQDAVVGDRRVWAVAQQFPRKHLSIPSVHYETKIASHYLERGEEPPEDSRVIVRFPNESHFRSIPYREIRR